MSILATKDDISIAQYPYWFDPIRDPVIEWFVVLCFVPLYDLLSSILVKGRGHP